ncbi:hypothetical protein IKN40_05380 [bacterium]|nr:hypothetical protein [bacterium]
MLDNEEVKKEVLNYLGDNGIKMITKFYKEYHNVFPLIVEDGVPISINLYLGMPLRNYINEKFNIVPDKIKNWIIYEDYIYNMVMKIAKENGEK